MPYKIQIILNPRMKKENIDEWKKNNLDWIKSNGHTLEIIKSDDPKSYKVLSQNIKVWSEKIDGEYPSAKTMIKRAKDNLYTDANPTSTLKGLGFKDESKAKYTIEKIKDKPIAYQKQVIITMYHRAKYHPYRTE
mgnify:CR=1 FL=1